jgi:purine-binding chemotaxis protein CheW
MTATTTEKNNPPEVADLHRSGKYLTFNLGEEEYGLPLLRVREINALMVTTPVPLTPDYVRGVMNLRGKVIPVVDLRCKFGMTPTPDHDRKCIIVVDVHREEEVLQMSVLVDAVSEVLHIASDDIENAPSINADVHLNFIQGIAKTKGTIKILLDVDTVLGAVELSSAHLTEALQAEPAQLN